MMTDGTNMHEFAGVLEGLYNENPCQVLPNALWKTQKRLSFLQCSHLGTQDNVVALKAWDQEGLYVFWNQSREVDQTSQQFMENCSFLIIHEDYYRQIDVAGYRLVKPFFRLKHISENIPTYSAPDGFYIKDAMPVREAHLISDFVARCYKDLKPSPETVRSWTMHEVFDPTLWVWIIDQEKDVPVALGIAEFDPTIAEGSLEWIQVLPEYQGRGLGKVIVLELLSRLKGKAKFTTVSGEVANATNPERLYRSCGFIGEDTWWLLQR